MQGTGDQNVLSQVNKVFYSMTRDMDNGLEATDSQKQNDLCVLDLGLCYVTSL